MKKPSIFIDLDDTLIHSINGSGRNPGRRTVINLEDGEVYHSLARPLAGAMLSELREIGDVRMLTTAVRSYALAHNEAFALGFSEEEIYARERYVQKVSMAYSSEWVPVERNHSPEAFLIDNLGPRTESSLIKMAFLGADSSRYIMIREFYGKDPECFSEEFKAITEKIRQAEIVPVRRGAGAAMTIAPGNVGHSHGR